MGLAMERNAARALDPVSNSRHLRATTSRGVPAATTPASIPITPAAPEMVQPSDPVNAAIASAGARNAASGPCATAVRAITAPATAPPTMHACKQYVMHPG